MKLKDIEQPRARNFVAKHSQSKSGAGRHITKKGKGSYRKSDRKKWKKDIHEMEGDFLPYDETRSMELAKEFWRMSEGDLKKALKLADNYASLLKFKIKAHAGKQGVRRV